MLSTLQSYHDPLLPQELLFQISEYGDVHPDLTSQYMLDATRPYNINWPFQFLLRYIISQCPVYRMLQQCKSRGVKVGVRISHGRITLIDYNDPFNDLFIFQSTKDHMMSTIAIIDYLSPGYYTNYEGGYTYSNKYIKQLEQTDHKQLNELLPHLFPQIPTDLEIIEAMRQIDTLGLALNLGEIIHVSIVSEKFWKKYQDDVNRSELIRYLIDCSFNGEIFDICSDPTGRIHIAYNLDQDTSSELLRLILNEYNNPHTEGYQSNILVRDVGCEVGSWIVIEGLDDKLATYYRDLGNDLKSVLCPYE
uniref:Uncharacterized protein n=1 Tax=viral metagenome TaxID=1070528 RepID=A0A6C0BN94_9ZZZZ